MTDDSSRPPADPSEASSSKEDVVLVHGVTTDRKGLMVLRKRDDRIEAGEVRPVIPGAPLYGDIVKLRPREDRPYLCDVETQFSLPTEPGKGDSRAQVESGVRFAGHGPPQVATSNYRDNWDKIWSRDGEDLKKEEWN